MGFFRVSLWNKNKEVFFMINKTQLVVQTDKATIEWLESQGYRNVHNLPNNYTFPVFTVDLPSKTYGGTNTTCMAMAVTQGHRPIVLNLEHLKEKLSTIEG